MGQKVENPGAVMVAADNQLAEGFALRFNHGQHVAASMAGKKGVQHFTVIEELADQDDQPCGGQQSGYPG